MPTVLLVAIAGHPVENIRYKALTETGHKTPDNRLGIVLGIAGTPGPEELLKLAAVSICQLAGEAGEKRTHNDLRCQDDIQNSG
jgi:hypothetical protein